MKVLLSILSLLLLASCTSLQSEDHETAELYMRMGVSQYEQGNYPYALKSLLKAKELNSDNPAILNNLALVYFARQRYDLAEANLRQAIKLNANFSDARNNLSRVLIERGKFEEAEREAKVVTEDLTYPTIEKAFVNLGLAQFKQQKFAQAKVSFLKAIENQKDNCLAHSYYGRCLFELKDYPQATKALDRAIGFCQSSLFDEPHYYSALAHFRNGSPEKAESRFEEILKLYPNGDYREKSKAMLDLIRKGK